MPAAEWRHAQPRLVDHHNQPVDPTNEIAKLDSEIAKLPDLGELQAKVDPARRLGEQAKRATLDFIARREPSAASDRASLMATPGEHRRLLEALGLWSRTLSTTLNRTSTGGTGAGTDPN